MSFAAGYSSGRGQCKHFVSDRGGRRRVVEGDRVGPVHVRLEYGSALRGFSCRSASLRPGGCSASCAASRASCDVSSIRKSRSFVPAPRPESPWYPTASKANFAGPCGTVAFGWATAAERANTGGHEADEEIAGIVFNNLSPWQGDMSRREAPKPPCALNIGSTKSSLFGAAQGLP